MDRKPLGATPGGGRIPGTIRRRVCKGCGRFADEHGRRRRNGACYAFVFSHSILCTWNAARDLYAAREEKRADPTPQTDFFVAEDRRERGGRRRV